MSDFISAEGTVHARIKGWPSKDDVPGIAARVIDTLVGYPTATVTYCRIETGYGYNATTQTEPETVVTVGWKAE